MGILLRGCAIVIAALVLALGVGVGIAAWMTK